MVFAIAAAKAGPGASSANAWRRALELTAPIASDPCRTLPLVIDALAEWFGDAPALLSDAARLSYRELADRARGYARWALEQGTGKGDVVALLLPNCPDYLAIWLGVTRIGGIVALTNTNLVGDLLLHSIAVAKPRHLIVGAGLADAVAAIRNRLDPAIRLSIYGGKAPNFELIEPCAGCGVDIPEPPSLADTALYIYTSGTTGLPKAAKSAISGVMQWSHWFAGMMDTRPDDRMYNCLPMYHSVGGVVATGAVLVGGGSVVIREKFSASRLLGRRRRAGTARCSSISASSAAISSHAPPHPRRDRGTGSGSPAATGCGPTSGRISSTRFRIPQILEFYAATEGNVSLYNVEGKPGAIGRIPPFLAHRFPVALVRFDLEHGEPLRDADGFCIRCAPDEIGEAIGKIATIGSEPGQPVRGLYRRGRHREEDPARRLRARRRLVSHRRPDAQGRARLLLLRRPRRRHLPLEGRERLDRARSPRRSRASRSDRGRGVRRRGSRHGRPRRHGRDRRRGRFRSAALRRHLAERLPAYARPVFLRIRGAIRRQPATFKTQEAGDLAPRRL